MAEQYRDANAVFQDLYDLYDAGRKEMRTPEYLRWTNILPSDAAYEKLAHPTALATPRPWRDERKPSALSVNAIQQFDHERYESSVDISYDSLSDARAWRGMDQIIEEEGAIANHFRDKTMSEFVALCESALAYDGVPFYAASGHYYAKAGSHEIVNLLTGTGITVDKLHADLGAAIAKLRTFRNNAGVLLNANLKANADHLVIVCHPTLAQTFRAVLNSSFYPVPVSVTTSGTAAAPAGTVMQGCASLVEDGYLTDENDWYLHYVGGSIKPFVLFEREKVKMQQLGPDSEYCVTTNKCLIGSTERFSYGAYAFYRSIKVKNT